MRPTLPIAIGFLCLTQSTLAVVHTLKRTTSSGARDEEWVKGAIHDLVSKYGAYSSTTDSARIKRQTGSGNLTNYRRDVAYHIPVQIGTPPQTFNIILDTGSSDTWLASSGCTVGCEELVNLYTPGEGSSSFNGSSPGNFSLSYVGGDISGTTARDTLSLVGFSVPQMPIGIVTTLQGTVLPATVSGLMGMAFSRLAKLGTPFWIRSAQLTPWSEPLFSFALSRVIDVPNVQQEEFGGTFTMGQTDPRLYQGEIEYLDVPAGSNTWWLLPVAQIGIGGQMYTINSGGIPSYAVIDTATSLIGGPSNIVQAIYAQIPGAQRATGEDQGYWYYPCATQVNLAFNFGGRTWPINPVDFALATSSASYCVGALFEVQLGNSAYSPQWIVGDSFLKNVYSVYRYEPLSVGFATMAGSTLAVPSASSSLAITASESSGVGSAFIFPTNTIGITTGLPQTTGGNSPLLNSGSSPALQRGNMALALGVVLMFAMLR